MNIVDEEARATWLAERFDGPETEWSLPVGTVVANLDLTHLTCGVDCPECQPPF